MVLFDPARSADPPIKVLLSFVIEFKISSELFLVAKLLISLTAFFFSDLIALLKLFLSQKNYLPN